jgi:hypothetical protein
VVELAAGVTIWGLWSCWLVAQHARAPALLTRSAATLLVAELVALAAHSFGCGHNGCNQTADLAGGAATYDIPALSATLVVLATSYAWRRAARAARAG